MRITGCVFVIRDHDTTFVFFQDFKIVSHFVQLTKLLNFIIVIIMVQGLLTQPVWCDQSHQRNVTDTNFYR